MNKYIVAGRLTRDPETKTIKVGDGEKNVASSSLAVKRFGKSDEVDFVEVSMWNNGADYFAKNYHKGDSVVIYGIPSARAYQTKDGNIKAQLIVTVNEIEKLSSQQRQEEPEEQKPEQTSLTPVSNGDLPF